MTDAELKARLQALIDTFVQDERAAVVAYLKALASEGKHHDPFWQSVAAGSWNFAAQMIERGEHRREEKP